MVDDNHAFEVLVTRRFFDYKGFKLVGMYEVNKRNNWKVIFIPNLSWVLGIGGHVSYYKAGDYSMPNSNKSLGAFYSTTVFPIGVDFIFGVEYNFKTLPLTFGLDARPFYEFYKGGPYVFDAGLVARYTID